MTDAPKWRDYVEAMVAKAAQHQDELYYRLSLPGWQAELQRLRGGDRGLSKERAPVAVEGGRRPI